jgi:hypothetical protein
LSTSALIFSNLSLINKEGIATRIASVGKAGGWRWWPNVKRGKTAVFAAELTHLSQPDPRCAGATQRIPKPQALRGTAPPPPRFENRHPPAGWLVAPDLQLRIDTAMT